MKFVKKDINYYNKIVKKIPFSLILMVEIVSALLSLRTVIMAGGSWMICSRRI